MGSGYTMVKVAVGSGGQQGRQDLQNIRRGLVAKATMDKAARDGSAAVKEVCGVGERQRRRLEGGPL